MASPINRRMFLKSTAVAAAGAYAARALPALASSERGAIAITTPLNVFPYQNVQLLDGPMKVQSTPTSKTTARRPARRRAQRNECLETSVRFRLRIDRSTS